MFNTENIIKVILAFLLLICLFNMPYGYFQLIRFIGMVIFIVIGYEAYENKEKTFMVIWFASAVLINPIFKIALGRTVWNVVDVVWAITLIGSLFYEYEKNVVKRKLLLETKNNLDVNIEQGEKEQPKENTPTSPSRKRKTLELRCKASGIPFSRNTMQSGTASIRFINKPKREEKKEE